MLTGKHLVAGQWIGSDEKFQNTPIQGKPNDFAVGTPELVNQAVLAAEDAFWSYGFSDIATRATFLRCIAKQIDERGADISKIGSLETGLPQQRLEGERARTVGQLELFAEHIETKAHLDQRYDAALPDRQPLARPEIRLAQRPIGPVAVFGASNFPLAFSTAGGDTAAALAAGCPVIVKGHSAHPGVSDIVAQAVLAAIEECGIAPGVFSQIQGGNRQVGQTLVQHPLINAVGFTGSLAGGRALFDLCMSREVPIPFFGELGSVNPVFVLDDALKQAGSAIAEQWAASLTMGAGQFCTNPGLVIVREGENADAFVSSAKSALEKVPAQHMLTAGIASAFHEGTNAIANQGNVSQPLKSQCGPRTASPQLFETDAETWLANALLAEEVFGPLGVVVKVSNADQMIAIAKSLQGQLTCTLHLTEGDTETANNLMPILERKAGRVLANGFSTGVEVCDSMVHGGPYPASTNFGATSVGTLSIRRFLRPVCYQNIPAELLPADVI